MKLSLLTYLLGKDMDLDTLLGVVTKHGIPALELRAELGHRHGVELEASPAERAAIRAKCQDAGVAVCSIATGCRFQSLDPAERAANVDRAKRFLDLARDVGAPRIRVFGDRFEGNDVDTVVGNVGECLGRLGAHAADRGVDVCLEMHGDFYRWQHALRAVELAAHPRVGLVHNCDPRELADGPFEEPVHAVRAHIRHVHVHDLESDRYPYKDYFALMRSSGYDGYFSLECSASADPERVIGLYAALFRELVAEP